MKIVGFFCEDLRPETAGTETIVGVLPDNMIVPGVPGAIPKLAIYLRIQIDMHEAPELITVTLKAPWGETIPLGKTDKVLIEKAQQAAKDSNLPIAGIVMRAMLSPFGVQGYGLITAVAEFGGAERVCAMLNIRPPDPVSATASEPPAAQSSSVS